MITAGYPEMDPYINMLWFSGLEFKRDTGSANTGSYAASGYG